MTMYQIVETDMETYPATHNSVSFHLSKENAKLKAKSLNEIAIQEAQEAYNKDEYKKSMREQPVYAEAVRLQEAYDKAVFELRGNLTNAEFKIQNPEKWKVYHMLCNEHRNVDSKFFKVHKNSIAAYVDCGELEILRRYEVVEINVEP